MWINYGPINQIVYVRVCVCVSVCVTVRSVMRDTQALTNIVILNKNLLNCFEFDL